MKRFLMAILVFSIISMPVGAATTDDYLRSSDIVQVTEWTQEWGQYVIWGGRTDRERARKIHNFVVANLVYNTVLRNSTVYSETLRRYVPLAEAPDRAKFIPPEDAVTVLTGIAQYLNKEVSDRPKALCGGFANVEASLLRSVGLPSLIEYGYYEGVMHARTRFYLNDEKRWIYDDPSLSVILGKDYFAMSDKVYGENWSFSYIASETAPVTAPSMPGSSPDSGSGKPTMPGSTPDYSYPSSGLGLVAVEEDWRGIVDVPFNGRKVPMRVMKIGGKYYFSTRDTARMLDNTAAEFYMDYKSLTLSLRKGTYNPKDDANWTRGESPHMDMDAPVYVVCLLCDGKEVADRAYISNGVTYVVPGEVAERFGGGRVKLNVKVR
jgi:hypothetical protein